MGAAKNTQVAERRAFVLGLPSITAFALGACAVTIHGARRAHALEDEEQEAGVTPGEDLMQEHGVLERILLVYDDVAARLESGRTVDPSPILTAAGIVRRFVEDYHERLEETFVFPRLEQVGEAVSLVATLKDQHAKGRELTDAIGASARELNVDSARLAELLRSFSRMYRPHAAREETVVIPAFRNSFEPDAYRELGEKFEQREHELLGEGAFEKAVEQVSQLESTLGIEDLASFTPR